MAKKRGRKSLPKLEFPFTADLRTGLPVEAAVKQAEGMLKFNVAKDEWQKACRVARSTGDPLPEFKGKFVNPNTGRITPKAKKDLIQKWNDGENVSVPPLFSPFTASMLADQDCERVLRRGNKSEPPKDWDEKTHGSWWETDENGEKSPSRWYVDKDPPRNPIDKAEKLVADPDKNIITVGNARYVVGGGSYEDSSVFMINAHRPKTNNGSIERTRKAMCLKGMKGLANLVFKIEDKPNNGPLFVVKIDAHGTEACFLPGQVMTPGYLSDGDKELTAKQIRALGDDAKGIRFKAISAADPMLTPIVPFKEMWPEIRKAEGKKGITALREREGPSGEDADHQKKTITNCGTQCRLDAGRKYAPFGFKFVAIGMVPIHVGNADDTFGQGIVIGARNNEDYGLTCQEAKRAANEAEGKPKKVKKVAKPKDVKSDKAPPVEHEESEQVEVSETTEEQAVAE